MKTICELLICIFFTNKLRKPFFGGSTTKSNRQCWKEQMSQKTSFDVCDVFCRRENDSDAKTWKRKMNLVVAVVVVAKNDFNWEDSFNRKNYLFIFNQQKMHVHFNFTLFTFLFSDSYVFVIISIAFTFLL